VVWEDARVMLTQPQLSVVQVILQILRVSTQPEPLRAFRTGVVCPGPVTKVARLGDACDDLEVPLVAEGHEAFAIH
jgi:hypothetical protein